MLSAINRSYINLLIMALLLTKVFLMFSGRGFIHLCIMNCSGETLQLLFTCANIYLLPVKFTLMHGRVCINYSLGAFNLYLRCLCN